MELYLIRHGKTAGNLAYRYIGCNMDEPLLKETFCEIQTPAWKAKLCFLSPMLRCRQTAQALFGEVPYYEIPDLREMDFGDFEGKNYQELNGDPRYQAWIDGGGIGAFPQGEDRACFIRRNMAGFKRMLERMAEETEDPEKPFAAVVHGGTIMAILSSLTGGNYFDYQVACLEGYHLHFSVCREEGEVHIDDLSYERICFGLSH